MGDYTNMSTYYDLIMTSGYYDYSKIVDHLLTDHDFKSVLEIGCGTGLIMEEMARREASIHITGVDLTAAMLQIARQRLQSYSNVDLLEENITQFELNRQYDMAFSYGGVWYFVIDGEQEPFMVSHIRDEALNATGFERIAAHVTSGGHLMLGVQGPHADYEKPISNGMVYSQKIEPDAYGFLKHYYLADQGVNVMAQSTHYRTYTFEHALNLLGAYGFSYVPETQTAARFLKFRKGQCA